MFLLIVMAMVHADPDKETKTETETGETEAASAVLDGSDADLENGLAQQIVHDYSENPEGFINSLFKHLDFE